MIKLKYFLLVMVVFFFFLTGSSFASSSPRLLSHSCVTKVSKSLDIPYWLIITILDVEGGWIGLKKKNPNNTYDYGPMQINSIWLPELNKKGVSEQDLQYDGCVNVLAGTWILAQKLKEVPDSLGRAIAAYHSKTPHLNKAYQKKVLESIKRNRSKKNIVAIFNRANAR